MPQKSHCFDILLEDKITGKLPEVVVAYGDDSFLRRATYHRLLKHVCREEEEVRTFDGDECVWRDVHDELATLSLFDPLARRIAFVANGDHLVKNARAQLEKWCAAPAPESLLFLELSSFPANTKLFKVAAENGWCIDCSAPKGRGFDSGPDSKAVEKWVAGWSGRVHGLHLTSKQVTTIVDLVGGDEFGLLHQELSKLALFADERGQVTDETLKTNVGSWRTQTVWKIVEAIAEGKTALALNELQKVFLTGESPAAVVPQLSWSLRRFGVASHLVVQAERVGQPISLSQALSQAGFRPYELEKAQRQLVRIGRRRAVKLLDELLNLDLKLKGSHSHLDRSIFAIEEFVAKLG